MKDFIKLLRPKQWSKNLLVFAAILFTNEVSNRPLLLKTLLAFAAMCLISSSTYIVNDIRDRQKDLAHPKKKNRPIASGRISPVAASVVAAVIFVVALVSFRFISEKSLIIALLYVAIQIVYNLGAKTVPVLDVFLISSGFVLRAMLGAAAIEKEISAWLLLCTGALALLLGFGKRRQEFISQGENRAASRESLAGYSKPSLDALVIMAATASALCYGIYALQSPTAKLFHNLFITSVFVFYGICRYVLIVFSNDEGGEPESLLFKDRHILLSVLLFVVAAIVAMNTTQFPLIN
ncbi:MAG TPA: decaprenyl-phosphate phosphoribosyltransferase [Fimbriimonadaceae bacterium]|jgi:4-hydroxybenzoate polyprenyltransferase